MEIRVFAERVLGCSSVAAKLAPIDAGWTDHEPGKPERVGIPARPIELRFHEGSHAAKMPKASPLNDPRLRAIAHHIMANHELQALEAMAWTLLAFPDAPASFRRGLVHIMTEEQAHTRWHMDRAAELGMAFGEARVNGYVWKHATASETLLEYLACLPLTFEGSNLDHSQDFADRFARGGDERSADVMRRIHDDEIRHVAFGLVWLRRLKDPNLSDWDAYVASLRRPLKPCDARGKSMDRESRLAAGLLEDFIARLDAADESAH